MIKFGSPQVAETEIKNVLKVINSGVYVHGPMSASFETGFAKRFNYKNTISVASCTAALHLSHYSLSKKILATRREKLEVICPAMTHVATAHAIELAGLKPIFVDCNAEDGNIDVGLIEEKISGLTVGIAPMHFNGLPCDMVEIMKIAERYSLYVVEDCAISLGAKINGKPIGTYGDVGCFSFHPVKQMTTGEGGMIVTKSNDLKETLFLERAFGVDRTFTERTINGVYDVPILGFNYRLPEIPAAIGIAQLERFTEFENTRKRNFIQMTNLFSNFDRLKIKGGQISDDRAYYCLIAELTNSTIDERNTLVNSFKDNGLQTSIYYPHPVPRLKYYADKYGYDKNEFKNAINFSDNCISFSIGAHLSDLEICKTADIINRNI